MKITCADSGDWIEFIPVPEISDRSFAVIAVHDRCRVHNNSLALLETAPFLEELARLERTRRGAARLIGTYDFELVVESHGARGAALVRYRLEDQWFSVAANGMCGCRLNGVIEVPGEMVASLLDGFRELLAPTA